MKQSPSREASSFSASQEIPQILWNPAVQYHINNTSSIVLKLSEMNPVQTLPFNLSDAL